MEIGGNYIVHNRPTLEIEEERAAINTLRSGWIAQGSEVEKCENDFCEFLNISKGSAVAVSSGTAALYLSLLALDAEGKKIAFPTYVCSAVRHADTLAKGKQVLQDSSLASPNMKLPVSRLLSNISIVPHMYGIPQEIHT